MPTFEVNAPDGKTYRVDAPEGSTQDDAIRYVASQHYGIHESPAASVVKTSARPEYTTESSPLEAIGGGMVKFGRGAGNMLVHAINAIHGDDNNLSSLVTGDKRWIKGGAFSDEAVKEQEDTDKDLEEAHPFAYTGGEIAASLPLTMATGGLSNAARAVPIAGRVLGSGALRAVLEGAGQSAILADPDERGNAALEGGMFGGVLHGTLGALGRTVRGVLQKSQATQDLEQLAGQSGRDLFVPASQAGGDEGDLLSRMTGSVYKHMLPLFPGVSGQLKRQAGKAENTVREMALSEADPIGTIIKPGSGKDATMAMGELADAFDQEYRSTVGSYAFNVPQDLAQQLEARVRAAMPNVDDVTLKKAVGKAGGAVTRFASGNPVIDGENLLNAKGQLSGMIENMDAGPEKRALQAATGWIEEHIDNEMMSGGSKANAADLQRYQELAEPMSNFKQVSQAVEAAKAQGGRFSPGQLATAADPSGTIAHLGQTANQVMGTPAAQASSEGRILAYLSGGYGAFHGLAPGALTLTAGANALATKTAQRIVMGDTAAQKAMSAMLAKHPEMARRVQTVLRLTGSSAIGNANARPDQSDSE